MTQLFFQEFVSQLWRLNSITKLEEINFSLSCHLHWKDGCWQATYLCSDRFWTAVQKHPELLLSCTFPGHQTLLWQGVTTALIFSRKLHCLWWSGGNKGGKSLQNKITAGKVSRMWLLRTTQKCKWVTGNVLIFICWKHEEGWAILVLGGSTIQHQTSSGCISASNHTTYHPCSG